MAYTVGLVVGQNTNEPFTITKVLTKEETTQRWCVEQGKSYPHDKAYEIKLKCGKLYYTLNTQITKCIQRDWGWNKCKGCDGNKSCSMDSPISHTLSVIPNRNANFTPGEIFGDLKLIDFAFNAKRHNYYEFECIHCGTHLFRMTPTNKADIESCRCPACTDIQYKGPRRIKEYLDAYEVTYLTEFRFNDCVYKSTLPFDFAILDSTNQIQCLIEYDGEQHFEFIKHWHGDEEGFELQKLRDSIKTKYCKEHNIKLIRIPYTEYDNIEEILKNNSII